MLSPSISSEIRTCPPIGILSEGMHAERTAFQVLLERLQAGNAQVVPPATAAAMLDDPDDRSPVEWSEEDIVFLHWRLLQEISHLADPDKPLEEKFDTLRWIFTEREKDRQPFSFVNCLRVVGCSPLSPIAYCGLVDAQEVRDRIQNNLKAWLSATLERYPAWVREAVIRNPEWAEARLLKNPQWINEQLKRLSVQDDLFA